jgi:HK97 family phage major capsid protein
MTTPNTFTAIKDAIDHQATAFEAFKKVNDQQIQAVKSGNDSLAAELGEKLKKIETDVTTFGELKKSIEIEMDLQRDRIEELESRSKTPGRTATQKRHDEYKGTFNEWVRNKGNSPLHEQKLQDQMRKMVEAKDITIGSSAGGGFALPEEIAREIERLELKFSPVRRLVKVVQAGTFDYKEIVNLRGATSGWVGETGSRPATNTPQLREVVPTNGELYAYPQVSEWSLDDIFFNVEAWLSEEIAQEFALQEGTAVITGNGSSKPTGMLNTTPVTTADFASPLRAAAAYQYIANTSSPTGTVLLPDSLITLIYTLNSAYRSGAMWTMNSVTLGAVRRLKDNNGQYLWQPSLQAGQPDSLLGYAVETWEQMQDIANNNFPIAFGNFRRGYVLADRVGLRVTRDNVTNIGFVRFYVRRREGGIVLNNDAIKFLRTV